MEQKIKSIFHNSEEKLISILGQNYIDSILRNSKLKKSSLILSDKRIYQKGIIYEREGSGKFSKTQGTKIVDIENITGTSFVSTKNIVLLVIAISLIVLALLFVIASSLGDSRDSNLSPVPVLLFDIIIWIWYFYTKNRFFQIEYAGGAIATEIGWYKISDIEDFQRQISIEKEKLKGNISSDTIECPFCAERIKRNARICRYCNRELPK